MQMEQAQQLRTRWEADGDKPCPHPKTEREYYLGTNTGDHICTTCGAALSTRRPLTPDDSGQTL